MDKATNQTQSLIETTVAIATLCMLANILGPTLKEEARMLKKALGHEPTLENWGDYFDLKEQARSLRQGYQREIDKAKLLRLVMSGDDASSGSD